MYFLRNLWTELFFSLQRCCPAWCIWWSCWEDRLNMCRRKLCWISSSFAAGVWSYVMRDARNGSKEYFLLDRMSWTLPRGTGPVPQSSHVMWSLKVGISWAGISYICGGLFPGFNLVTCFCVTGKHLTWCLKLKSKLLDLWSSEYNLALCSICYLKGWILHVKNYLVLEFINLYWSISSVRCAICLHSFPQQIS